MSPYAADAGVTDECSPGAAGRWMVTGSSGSADARLAGEEATRAAVRQPDARLLLVFCSASHDPRAVLDGIRAVAPEVPLIGCSTTAAVSPDGPADRAVVVVALGGAGFSVATRAAPGATAHRRDVGAEVAGCVTEDPERPHRVLLLLTDGLTQDPEEIVTGVYGVVGASVPLVGGSACPDPTMTSTFQLHGDDVLSDALVGAAIASDAPFGIGLGHGWRKVGEPMIVTKSARGCVQELDGRPAVEAYLGRLGAPAEAYTDRAAFERFAERRPIGVRVRRGEAVRNVGSSSYLAQGWLHSSGDVAEGALVWPMDGDEASVLAAAREACRDAIADVGRAPLGLLAFDCETRSRFLGPDGRRDEHGLMAAEAGAVPVAGLYTWGEIARTRGVSGFHNQTLVVLAVG